MNKTDKDLLETAMQWRITLADTTCTESQRREFGQWLLADSRNAKVYDDAEHYWSQLSEIKDEHLSADLLKPTFYEHIYLKITNFLSHVRHPVSGQITFGLSSVVAIFFAMFFLFQTQINTNNNELVTRTYVSNIGEVKYVTLSDGSVVTLGADTSIYTIFSASFRNIYLTKGEAYFDVAKDITRPFSVQVHKLKATATGTEFEVRKRKNKVEVSVSEGSVNVTFPFTQLNNSTQHTVINSKQLTQGQQVDASLDNGLNLIKSVDVKNIGAWKENRFVYFDAPLSDIIFDAKRYYSAPIVVTNEALKQINISAIFDGADVQNMFLTLSETFPMHVDVQSDGMIVISALN